MARIEGSQMRAWQHAGAPSSGTSGTLAGEAVPGAFLWDKTNGVYFVNEGSLASPYWTPVGYDQAPLFGIHTDFRDQGEVAVAGSAASATIAGSGLRVFGDGAAENDSGLVAQTAAEGGIVAYLTTTDEDLHVLAIGMDAGVMQPDQHQLLVIDVVISMITALTDRAFFVGFLGTAADALVTAFTAATTVATLVQDDMAGLCMDSEFTDADALYGVHNKSNAAATMTAGVLSPLTNLAAAGTYQRFRVEIAADGDMTCFVDKVQVYSQAIALDVDEECAPVCYVTANAGAVKTMAVRRFAAWAYR